MLVVLSHISPVHLKPSPQLPELQENEKSVVASYIDENV